MLEVDLINEQIREIDLNKVDEIHCQKCGKKIKGRMGRDIYITEYDVHRYTKILLCPSCKKRLTTWAAPKLTAYEKTLVTEWVLENPEQENIDERAILIQDIIATHDCFLCKKLKWKEKCEQAKKSCDDFFIPELEKVFKR
jgi:hypothetical protein